MRAPRALTLTERAAYGRRMVHWLDDAMPLQSAGEACAVVMRANDAGEAGGRCYRLPVVEARCGSRRASAYCAGARTTPTC